jgi:GNAT superfamily N-acetyltransferase
VLVRVATPADAASIALVANRAYQVEAFFVRGDRTSVADVERLMRQGRFLVIDRHDSPTGRVACVFTSVDDDRGYVGMLAVEPEAQGHGLGNTLIQACETDAARSGCGVMAIKVVNLRTDLIRHYERLGYVVVSTEPYVNRPIVQPCHFVNMEKPLGGR